MMQFIVISHSESGPLVEEFETKTKAVDFESDQLCNISSDMVKDIKERFGIMLADAEVAIDPKKITDCEGWVSAELHDRYALYQDKLEKRRNAA